MSFWDSLLQGIANIMTPRPAPGPVIANTWPNYEVNTPAYPSPNPYSLAQFTYNRNEIVYACVQKRATAVSEAPLQIFDNANRKLRKVLDNSPVRELIKRPNPAMSEVEFWQVVEIYTCVAGFSAWEIEFANGGKVLNLWPMRPDWCSFYRGENQPLRAIRYQPYGLPYVDVPIERVVLFSEFDPLFPMLKGLSKAAVALRSITTDNASTDFLANFFQSGTNMSGILTTVQSLATAEALRIQSLWVAQHGGVGNWSKPAVLGSGMSWQQTSMNFKDMDFTNLDGRNEARICAVFDVPPILIGAKVGLSASTYSNYEQARKAFYEETVFPRWQWFESIIGNQLLPHFQQTGAQFPGFDVTEVRALQEDRTLRWTRAVGAAEKNIITRDEARQEMGLDVIDKSPIFMAQAQYQPAPVDAPGDDTTQADTTAQVDTTPSADTQAQGTPSATDVVKALVTWRASVLKAYKEGKLERGIPPSVLPETVALPIWHGLEAASTSAQARAVFEKHWPKPPAKAKPAPKGATLDDLVIELKAARAALEIESK